MADYTFLEGPQLAFERAKIYSEAVGKDRQPVLPEYSTGARSVIYVNNQKIGVALECTWSVSIEHIENRTIDANVPWELIPGQATIQMTMRRIIHPRSTAASSHLFTTIQAALHTPSATVEVKDRLGIPLFVAIGSFTQLNGSTSVGQTSIESVRFQGYYWQQNDQQTFDPQSAYKSAGEKLSDFGNQALTTAKSLVSF